MAFSGGVFSRLFSWTVDAANGVKIRADRMDQEMTGFATGLSTCITKDGQTTITANLPMGGFRHTGVGNGVARNDYAAFGQLQDQAGVFVAAANVGGTADAITLTPAPAITAYAAGQRFSFVAEATNTTAVTVATSGLTARAVTKEGSTALVAGDILIGALVTIQDDGTRYQLVAVNGVATKQGDNTFTGDAILNGPFARGDGSELTISSGSITATSNSHTVDTESDAATDDLTDIDDANMPEGARLTLRANNAARTVVVKHGSGTHKIQLADNSDLSLDDNQKSIELELRSGTWNEISRSPRGPGIGTAVAATSGTAIDFTGIPAGVKRVTVMFAGVSTTGTSALVVQLGDSGGIETAGYSSIFTQISGAAVGGTNGVTVGFALSDSAAGAVWKGAFTFTLLDESTNTWVGTFMMARSDVAITNFGAGSKALSGALDRVRITTFTGVDTFDAGSVNILYE